MAHIGAFGTKMVSINLRNKKYITQLLDMKGHEIK